MGWELEGVHIRAFWCQLDQRVSAGRAACVLAGELAGVCWSSDGPVMVMRWPCDGRRELAVHTSSRERFIFHESTRRRPIVLLSSNIFANAIRSFSPASLLPPPMPQPPPPPRDAPPERGVSFPSTPLIASLLALSPDRRERSFDPPSLLTFLPAPIATVPIPCVAACVSGALSILSSCKHHT